MCSDPSCNKDLPNINFTTQLLCDWSGEGNVSVICKKKKRHHKNVLLVLQLNMFITNLQGPSICYKHSYTPRNEVRGVYWNHHVRPSVCPAAFGFPAHNCFPFTPIIMKLHMQTPHEARMCPIDFEVKGQRSRSQCINYWKWFPAHNCFPFTPIIMKLHMQTPHEARMCPIDFEVKRSKLKVTMHKLLKMVSGA